MYKYRFSVISVCYNCENDVERTINSLKRQTFEDYEYIVIDGASTDGTLTRVQNATQDMKNVRICSEKDNGIYDAMNKGVIQAEGEYIYFLNMGDELFDESVLNIVDSKIEDSYLLYYGDIVNDRKVDNIISQNSKYSLYWALYREYMICHQSIFAKHDLFFKQLFDCSYKICADRKWLIWQIKTGTKAKHIDYPIAKFDSTGVSSNYDIFDAESLRVTKENGNIPYLFVRLKRVVGRMKG